MASNTQGIQQLLTAEKRAAEKVSEARKRKNRRLKQAKEEAQAEIERYKAEREGQFREHEARYAGSKGDFFKISNTFIFLTYQGLGLIKLTIYRLILNILKYGFHNKSIVLRYVING